MLKVFISLVIGLIIINITYSILPDNGYNKYVKVIVGVVLLLFIVNNITDIKLENSFYDFEGENLIKENKEYYESINRQFEDTINKELENEIYSKFKITSEVTVTLKENQIEKAEIFVKDKIKKYEIIEFLENKYQIDKGRIFVN